MTDTEVIVIRESLGESIAKDVSSVAALTAAVSLGVWLESSAMQWIGGVLWIIAIVSRLLRLLKDNRMSIEEARAFLDELEERP